ncbi:hypothetical protein [Mumia zhuanghuii]|uniref:Uncharacterized protein n=1 Tax=Mumia zhuanghuii TaxID=2585211 RepID=A0A5C4LVR6_9ACTN|nr:hypothetical protein [Mumia zhuanghuii]TNC22170.1 hypothetical protein FHE65_35825 [Mumia zhuanghuii]
MPTLLCLLGKRRRRHGEPLRAAQRQLLVYTRLAHKRKARRHGLRLVHERPGHDAPDSYAFCRRLQLRDALRPRR